MYPVHAPGEQEESQGYEELADLCYCFLQEERKKE